MKNLFKKIALSLTFALSIMFINPIVEAKAYENTDYNNIEIANLILTEEEIQLANDYIQSQINNGNIAIMPRSAAALAGTFFIPGVGQAVITAAGVIIVGGAVVSAGSWLGKKVTSWVTNYKIEQSYQNSKNKGTKTNDHSVQTGGSLSTKGRPNSSKDLKDSKGIKQRRYYDKNGNADLDIDYRHGGNGKEPFPHKHKWTNGVRGKWFK